MRGAVAVLIAAEALAGCSSAPKSAQQPVKTTSAPAAVKITQFYASKPSISRGDSELLCYGVENAKIVTLSPPRQELSAAYSRCVEVKPTQTTTYTLTAEGDDGQKTTQDISVTVGAPRVHIVEVQVSQLEVHPGDAVSLCYKVENARAVHIEPVRFQGGAKSQACAVVNPRATTTYVVTATGPSGDTDQEKVTVKVH